MAKIIDFDAQGHVVYHGLLSQQEVDSYQEVINALKAEFPEIEKELLEKYPSSRINGTSIEYKYYLGKALANYLEKYDVTEDERRRFYDEITNLASEETKKLYTREAGKKAKTRSIFEQFYLLSHLDIETTKKLNWGEWQTLFDRVICREDPRIFEWVDSLDGKISRDDWRSFMKILNMYCSNIDTSVFSDEEFKCIFDSLLLTGKQWVLKYKLFKKEHPNSAKSKAELKWSKKFYQRCFELKKENRSDIMNQTIIDEAFYDIMEKDFVIAKNRVGNT